MVGGDAISVGWGETSTSQHCHSGVLRTLVLIAVLHGTASADSDVQVMGELAPPEVEYIVGPPPEIATALDDAAIDERSAKFEVAIERTSHPLARANLLLARADLWAAHALKLRARALVTLDAGDDIVAATALGRALGDYELIAKAPLTGWPNFGGALARYAFLLGFAHMPEALRVYRRIVDDLPTSPHAVRAHLALGEAARTARQIETARLHFAAVALPNNPPKERAFALYRLGWIELEEHGQAERAFGLYTQALALDTSDLLASELRQGLTKAYSLFGNVADAYATFARQSSPAHALEMLDELERLLRINRRSIEAIRVLGELARRAPDDPRACDWQGDAVSYALELRDELLFLTEVERLARLFVRIRHHAIDAKLIEQCEGFVVVFARGKRDNKALQRRLEDLLIRTVPEHAELAK